MHLQTIYMKLYTLQTGHFYSLDNSFLNNLFRLSNCDNFITKYHKINIYKEKNTVGTLYHAKINMSNSLINK